MVWFHNEGTVNKFHPEDGVLPKNGMLLAQGSKSEAYWSHNTIKFPSRSWYYKAWPQCLHSTFLAVSLSQHIQLPGVANS